MQGRFIDSDSESSSNLGGSFHNEINITLEMSEEPDSEEDQQTSTPPPRPSLEFTYKFRDIDDESTTEMIIGMVLAYARNKVSESRLKEINAQLEANSTNFPALRREADNLLHEVYADHSGRSNHHDRVRENYKIVCHKIKLITAEHHRRNHERLFNENKALKDQLSEHKAEILRLANELHELKKQTSEPTISATTSPKLFK